MPSRPVIVESRLEISRRATITEARTADPALPWYAAFAAALATASVARVIGPDPGGSWVALDDLVWLGAVALLLMAAWSDVGEAGRRTLESAIHVERLWKRFRAESNKPFFAERLALATSRLRRGTNNRWRWALRLLIISGGSTAPISRVQTITVCLIHTPRPTWPGIIRWW